MRRKRRNELIMKALQFESASWILMGGDSRHVEGYKIEACRSVEAPQKDDEEEQQQQEEELLHRELRMN